MRVDELIDGHLYADTNLFYMFLRREEKHRMIIRPFLKRVIQGQIELCVSPLMADELFYRLLLTRIKEVYGKTPQDVLRADSVIPIRRLSTELSVVLQRTFRLPHLHLISIEVDDIFRMLKNAQQYALMPRDALHLAIMQRLSLQDIVTDDTDFDRVSNL